jgi:hypothetical protein
MTIKSGKYGSYYEWVEDNETRRMPLWDTFNLTEEECELLVKGKAVDFNFKDYINSEQKTGQYKMVIKPNKKGGVYYNIEQINVKTVTDLSLIKTVYSKEKSFELYERDILSQLNKLDLVGKYKVVKFSGYTFINGQTTGTIAVTNDKQTVKHYLGTYLFEGDKILGELTEEEHEALLPEFKEYQAHKKQEEQKLIEQKKQEEIEKIKNRPWKQVTLEDINKEHIVDELNYIKNDAVLYEFKEFENWTNKSYRTNVDKGWTTYLIKNVLPGVTPKMLCELSSGFLREVSIEEYNWPHDCEVQYLMKITILGND